MAHHVTVNEVVVSTSTDYSDSKLISAGEIPSVEDIKNRILIKREDIESPTTTLNISDNGVHFQCSQCDALFVNEAELNNHLLSDHRLIVTKSSMSPPPQQQQQQQQNGGGSRCPFCQGTVRDLTKHLLTTHPDRLVAANNNNNETTGGALPIYLPRQPVPPSQLSPVDSPTPTGVSKKFPPLNIDKVKSEEVNLLLTVGSAPTSRPTSPIRHLLAANSHHHHHHNEAFPMNLSVRRIAAAAVAANGSSSSSSIRNSRSAPVSDEDEQDDNGANNNNNNNSSSVELNRKRRKQTHVPDQNKDERYWARRIKNNEAAKRSRDMRIKRERVVFEENSKLEKINQDLREELEALKTENKELHLKMSLVVDENARLKALLNSNKSDIIHQQQHQSSSTTTTPLSSPSSSPIENGNGLRQSSSPIKIISNKRSRLS